MLTSVGRSAARDVRIASRRMPAPSSTRPWWMSATPRALRAFVAAGRSSTASDDVAAPRGRRPPPRGSGPGACASSPTSSAAARARTSARPRRRGRARAAPWRGASSLRPWRHCQRARCSSSPATRTGSRVSSSSSSAARPSASARACSAAKPCASAARVSSADPVGPDELGGLGDVVPQLEDALEQRRLLAVGVDRARRLRRADARRQRGGAVARRAVVERDPRRDLCALGARLERAREREVQAFALAGEQVVDDDLAQERVAEGVPAVGAGDDEVADARRRAARRAARGRRARWSRRAARGRRARPRPGRAGPPGRPRRGGRCAP